MDRTNCDACDGNAGEVFLAFLKLGLTSFGGPIAHLGYFRDELVLRRRWIDEKGYADLVALCQFLPGPASSQVGFALGLKRAGYAGALAAWVAFTLPSAILLVAFGMGAAAVDGPLATGILSGLKIVAVAIVATAVWGMARALCPDRSTAAIALAALTLTAVLPGSVGQITAIVLGALAGGFLTMPEEEAEQAETIRFPVSRTVGTIALVVFAALLIGLPIVAAGGEPGAAALFDAFYRSGSLVFGGGHVVLPLLEAETVRAGWLSADTFLAGYGAAQAVPGPLFTFAAYLGTVLPFPPNGLPGASIALIAIFLPGMLLLIGILPFWQAFRRQRIAQVMMRGTNAAVVGILAAALYDPVFVSAIDGPAAFALAAICFVLLAAWKMAPFIVVLVAALGGIVVSTV
ncbi:chromate efflux transporter [Pararhizobium haloflavum]|uniref:chromate efflux transporter n=1 Tax=Pararhizobium haloflavum TaxID=2037914 RepID=UPI000C17A66B|nr:chromate efflux transporter [Pararhizobium haloflavum]